MFPPVQEADQDGRVAVGGDLKPGTLLAAYRNGLFPMPGDQLWAFFEREINQLAESALRFL